MSSFRSYQFCAQKMAIGISLPVINSSVFRGSLCICVGSGHRITFNNASRFVLLLGDNFPRIKYSMRRSRAKLILCLNVSFVFLPSRSREVRRNSRIRSLFRTKLTYNLENDAYARLAKPGLIEIKLKETWVAERICSLHQSLQFHLYISLPH